MEFLTPCTIETLEQIKTQFVRIDYIDARNIYSKFGKNPFPWPLGNQVKHNILVNFIFLCREQIPGQIMTLNS